MIISVSPTESTALEGLRAFLLDILPAQTEVIKGQVNRTPSPKSPDYVIMTPTRRGRLETNIDEYLDTKFTGSIAGAVLTVSTIQAGTIRINAALFGADITAGTQITAQTSGQAGGVGTYSVAPGQTVASEMLSAGGKSAMQPTMMDAQLDVHGPKSSDNAQTIATLFRDAYAVDFFAAGDSGVVPLHADDPQQLPFVNDQDQVEYRWVLQAEMQVNPTVIVQQEFADVANVTVINVEATYPP